MNKLQKEYRAKIEDNLKKIIALQELGEWPKDQNGLFKWEQKIKVIADNARAEVLHGNEKLKSTSDTFFSSLKDIVGINENLPTGLPSASTTFTGFASDLMSWAKLYVEHRKNEKKEKDMTEQDKLMMFLREAIKQVSLLWSLLDKEYGYERKRLNTVLSTIEELPKI